ncbi:MAG: AraC family ligand binding domain-containing protein [Pontiellaceae bacterium]|nr:AraC family ligand binding domain-containing protein [Pontiellaceae bacterium]
MTPEKETRETVVCGGKEQCAADYRIERRSFKFHAIEFVAAGRGTLSMEGNTYELRPGMIFCYGPRTPHPAHHRNRPGRSITQALCRLYGE